MAIKHSHRTEQRVKKHI